MRRYNNPRTAEGNGPEPLAGRKWRTMASLDQFVGKCIVLDTSGPLVYIGLLEACDERGYWLTDADVHDRSDGHSTKEKYINDAPPAGIARGRAR